MTRRAEVDTYSTRVDQTLGSASSQIDEPEEHPHAYLYLPDLSSRIGWASHAVPERREKPKDRQPMGFRR